MRRITTGLATLGVVLALSVAGCGGGGEATNAVSIKTLQTAAATSAEQSMRFTVDQQVDFGGKQFTLHADGVSSADGQQAQVTLSSSLTGDIEARVVDGVVYVNAGDGLLAKLLPSEKPWIRFDPGASGFGAFDPAQTTPKTGLDLLEELSGNVETVGDDTVAGRHAVHYRASVDAPGGQTGSVPIDVWIDDQDRVVKVEATIAPASVAGSGNGSVSMTMEVTEFDVPVDVVAPPDDQVSDFGGVAGLLDGHLDLMDAVELSVGWGVLHLFYTVDRDRAESDPQGGKRVLDAVRSLEADGHQALVFAVLGHKADLGVMALGPDLARLQAFQRELSSAPLTLVDSYVSLTELSEYTSTEDDERARLEAEEGLVGAAQEASLAAWRERMAHYRAQRLHPKLPLKRAICFYPMSKRRVQGANWYSLPFDARKRLMAGHARVGRTYAGRVLQLITGSTGLDDWEWGVTLLADDPVDLKDIVYEMRFDPVSAEYAEFGTFVTGLVSEPPDALQRVGL